MDWYIDVFEDGKDTREIASSFSKLKRDHSTLMIESEKTQKILKNKLKKTKSKLEEALKKLQEQQ